MAGHANGGIAGACFVESERFGVFLCEMLVRQLNFGACSIPIGMTPSTMVGWRKQLLLD